MEFRQVPAPIWLYALGMVVGTVLVDALASGPLAPKLLLSAIIFAWAYFLLKGLRWLWLFTIAISVIALGRQLIPPTIGWGIAVGVVSLVLLLLPSTRAYFST